ncbi:MAG: putative metal-dependent hydrolase with the TIM-barrel fold [Lacunisphaera sp.]|nr:putative metal-dependent hydrolase with the TIM-barrel fold [Lacunisphaera sp.]
MKYLPLFLASFALVAAEPADLMLVHGNIYTGAIPAQVQAIGVREGHIVFVGSDREAEKFRTGAKRVIDLGGRTLLPGLNDAHMHLPGVGFRELEFNLEGTRSVPDLRVKLQARVVQAGPKKWILGRGWIETHWTPAIFPRASDLDDLSPDNPVVLKRADGHAVVINSVALKLAGIDRSTPNPSGGEILRDPATGEATGMLVDEAMRLVERLVPPSTAAETERALVVGAQREVSLGWTGVQNAGYSFEEAEMTRRLVAEGKIKLRIYDAVSGPGPAAEKLFATGPVIGETNGRYTRRAVKLYIDGALGSRGAALLEPYSDYASSGLLMNSAEKLRPFLAGALRRGIQIETHAIGDRGNRLMLDLYAETFGTVHTATDPRWRIEHAQILNPADIPRFAQLGVIASMQPSHAIGDLYFAPARLGPARLAGAYAWQSLLQSGAVVAAGSDAPVERGEPMIEFYAAVARRSPDGFANADWHLEQRMTREQALRAMTLSAAYASFQEKDRGTIEVGKWADFTILSADIMKIPEPEILRTRCLMTIVGGEVVFEVK